MVSAAPSCSARFTAASSEFPVETMELPLDEALRMIDSCAIQDGKTIVLLQYAQRARR
jgi:hypothetical protein